MMDIYTSDKRSKIMSGIKGKDTKFESLIRKQLYSLGIRYRKNDIRFPGKPDILISKKKVAIFINGCFWHGHDCKKGSLPNSNTEFWEKKINNTKIRDKKNYSELTELGFRVIVLWECQLKKNYSSTVKDLINILYS